MWFFGTKNVFVIFTPEKLRDTKIHFCLKKVKREKQKILIEVQFFPHFGSLCNVGLTEGMICKAAAERVVGQRVFKSNPDADRTNLKTSAWEFEF